MAREFDGTEYYNDAGAVVTAPPFTISAWLRVETDTTAVSDWCAVQIQDSGDSSNYWRFQANSADIGTAGEFCFSVNATGGFEMAIGTTVPTQGVWYHVVGIAAAADDRSIWVDGSQEGTNTASRTPTGINSVTIGREGDSSPGDAWIGGIADLAIYDVALDADEIAALAGGASPLMVRPHRLQAFWPLRGRVSTEPELIQGDSVSPAAGTPAYADHPQVTHFPPARFTTPSAATGAFTLTAEAGSYSISGTDAGLIKDSLVTAEAGSYAITGTDAGLLAGLVVVAEGGSYAISGSAADLLSGHVIPAEGGSYTITGTNAALVVDSVITAESGSYTIAGQVVTLVATGDDTSVIIGRSRYRFRVMKI